MVPTTQVEPSVAAEQGALFVVSATQAEPSGAATVVSEAGLEAMAYHMLDKNNANQDQRTTMEMTAEGALSGFASMLDGCASPPRLFNHYVMLNLTHCLNVRTLTHGMILSGSMKCTKIATLPRPLVTILPSASALLSFPGPGVVRGGGEHSALDSP